MNAEESHRSTDRVAMPNRRTFVIPTVGRNLLFSATYKEKISRLRLEMTIAAQSPKRRVSALGRLYLPYVRSAAGLTLTRFGAGPDGIHLFDSHQKGTQRMTRRAANDIDSKVLKRELDSRWPQ